MNDLKTVRDALAITVCTIRMSPPEEIGEFAFGYLQGIIKDLQKQIDVLDRLSLPVGVKKIDGLEEAWSLNTDPTLNRAKEIDFIRKYDATFQGVIDDAARAYLKLQSGETEKVDLDALKLYLPYNSEDEKAYSNCALSNERTRGWNACIDHLANTGRLRQGMSVIDLGTCPIIVTGKDTAEIAAKWVCAKAIAALNTSAPIGDKNGN